MIEDNVRMEARVLVVDSGPETRNALKQVLDLAGCTVEIAENASQALKIVNEGALDLVIADFDLPAKDGLYLLRKIREVGEEPPVILMSGRRDVETAVEAMKSGALDFLQKPFPPEEVETLLSAISERKQERTRSRAVSGTREGPVIVTQNPTMLRLIELTRSVASSRACVLIQGESGTGKELFAKLLHESGNRSIGLFVAVNCAAIPDNLLESELFGHEKGAFTGAVYQRVGKFELADRGTLLLDEISEMAVPLQAKLLRVLQEYEITRVGGRKSMRLDVRVVATTNRDLKKEVSEGRFREDLYYRLNVIPLRIPPLRERTEDIPLLIRHFTEEACERNGKAVKELTKGAMEALAAHDWNGNVRELQNTIERAVLISLDEPIDREHLLLFDEPVAVQATRTVSEDVITFQAGHTMREVEKSMILHTLSKVDGNRTHAAKMLGISIRTLRNKINEYREKGEIPDI